MVDCTVQRIRTVFFLVGQVWVILLADDCGWPCWRVIVANHIGGQLRHATGLLWLAPLIGAFGRLWSMRRLSPATVFCLLVFICP